MRDRLRTRINHVKTYGKWQETIQAHINEAYSPPRVTRMSERMGMIPGFSLDLTTKDDKGEPWDFTKPEKRYKAMQWVKQKAALLLIVSPMCGPFSQLQSVNYSRMSDQEVRKKVTEGMMHLKFAMQLCRIQERSGLYFLFEHPRGASSWRTETMADMVTRKGTYTVRGDMCQFGMRQKEAGEWKPVMKPTRFMTNSREIAKILQKRCDGSHDHISLDGGRAKLAQVYPDELCRKICRGLMNQLEQDGRIRQGQKGIGAAEIDKPARMKKNEIENDLIHIGQAVCQNCKWIGIPDLPGFCPDCECRNRIQWRYPTKTTRK